VNDNSGDDYPAGPEYSQDQYHGLHEIYGLIEGDVGTTHHLTKCHFTLISTDIVVLGIIAPDPGKGVDL
jgi:hypothetical protein